MWIYGALLHERADAASDKRGEKSLSQRVIFSSSFCWESRSLSGMLHKESDTLLSLRNKLQCWLSSHSRDGDIKWGIFSHNESSRFSLLYWQDKRQNNKKCCFCCLHCPLSSLFLMRCYCYCVCCCRFCCFCCCFYFTLLSLFIVVVVVVRILLSPDQNKKLFNT